MKKKLIEHFWKVATNNPHHDTNWHDPAVIEFAMMIRKHTYDELSVKVAALPFGDTAASFAVWIRAQHDIEACASEPAGLRLRK
jgi:hypothetical protein